MTNESLIIYSMNKVGRLVPISNKMILRDISLGFYYGAKIGVLGLNGAGKSTLLRIMAGVDKDYTGEISMSKGYTAGMLEQEPKLDETKTVIENIREAVQPIVDMLKRYDEVNAKFAEPDADFDALIAIGCVIRGATYHFELVANESGAGVTRVALDHQIPIANAILTVDTEAQAWDRVEDKGRDAARVAVEMANLMSEL